MVSSVREKLFDRAGGRGAQAMVEDWEEALHNWRSEFAEDVMSPLELSQHCWLPHGCGDPFEASEGRGVGEHDGTKN
jgi:hypothetical protein